eukprot:Clim_evm138s147 gene=Clim_evmTU138s147
MSTSEDAEAKNDSSLLESENSVPKASGTTLTRTPSITGASIWKRKSGSKAEIRDKATVTYEEMFIRQPTMAAQVEKGVSSPRLPSSTPKISDVPSSPLGEGAGEFVAIASISGVNLPSVVDSDFLEELFLVNIHLDHIEKILGDLTASKELLPQSRKRLREVLDFCIIILVAADNGFRMRHAITFLYAFCKVMGLEKQLDCSRMEEFLFGNSCEAIEDVTEGRPKDDAVVPERKPVGFDHAAGAAHDTTIDNPGRELSVSSTGGVAGPAPLENNSPEPTVPDTPRKAASKLSLWMDQPMRLDSTKVQDRATELVNALAALVSHDHLGLDYRQMGLRCLLMLTHASPNPRVNGCLYAMLNNTFFHSVFDCFLDVDERQNLTLTTTLLLNILLWAEVNYYEDLEEMGKGTPICEILATVEDEVTLAALGTVMTKLCSGSINSFQNVFRDTKQASGGGWFSSLTSVLGSFVDGAAERKRNRTRLLQSDMFTFMLRLLITLNEHFDAVLMHMEPIETCGAGIAALSATSSTSVNTAQGTPSQTENEQAMEPAASLVSAFITFCSYLFNLDKPDVRTMEEARMCLEVMQLMSEDAHTNSVLHDNSLQVNTHIYRKNKRRQAPNQPPAMPQEIRPLACSILDILVDFIQNNKRRNLKTHEYLQAVKVIRRLLYYQKTNRIRLFYEWSDLWISLLTLMDFVHKEEALLLKSPETWKLLDEVVNVFNFFVIHGDAFLPDPQAYDRLYYEINRARQTVEYATEDAKRYMANSEDPDIKSAATALNSDLTNMRSIVKHFCDKITEWAAANQEPSISVEQAVMIIQKNYTSLTLRTHANFDRYALGDIPDIRPSKAFIDQLHKEVRVRCLTDPLSADTMQ